MDEARTRSAFPLIQQHVLLAQSGDIDAADAEMIARLSRGVIDDVLAALPDALLTAPPVDAGSPSANALRERYRSYLLTRLEAPRDFVGTAIAARERLLREPPRPYSARR